ncbi:MAG: hypothetical protein ACR2LK_07685, partial [Solirubrobacteraceae bacterium]
MSQFLEDLLGKPASLGGLFSYWAGTPVAPAVDAALNAHDVAVSDYLTAKRKGIASELALERLVAAGEKARERALRAIIPSLLAGLEQREGRRLRPLAVTHPNLAGDSIVWVGVVACFTALGVPPALPLLPPGSLLVCSGCTLVFRPKRKDERACDMCRKRKPNPGIPGGLPGSPGTDPLAVRLDELIGGAKPILEPSPWQHGERVTVGAPKLRDGEVVGWGEITLGLCPECGNAFSGYSNKATC